MIHLIVKVIHHRPGENAVPTIEYVVLTGDVPVLEEMLKDNDVFDSVELIGAALVTNPQA